jgi:hypothetical protein
VKRTWKLPFRDLNECNIWFRRWVELQREYVYFKLSLSYNKKCVINFIYSVQDWYFILVSFYVKSALSTLKGKEWCILIPSPLNSIPVTNNYWCIYIFITFFKCPFSINLFYLFSFFFFSRIHDALSVLSFSSHYCLAFLPFIYSAFISFLPYRSILKRNFGKDVYIKWNWSRILLMD